MSNSTLQSVDNALALIELLDREPREVSLTYISREMGLAKSTVHRLLSTLERRKYVIQNQETGKYSLDMKITHIGFNIMQKFNFMKVIRPYLENLSGRIGASVYEAIYSHGHITYIDEVIVPTAPFLETITGFNFPAHITSAGKLFLSEMSQEQVTKELENISMINYTPNSITSFDVLFEELANIRKNGYSIDNQEFKEGIISIAAPIRNRYNRVFAALCASGAASIIGQKTEFITNEILQTSRLVSQLCADYQ